MGIPQFRFSLGKGEVIKGSCSALHEAHVPSVTLSLYRLGYRYRGHASRW